MVEADALLHEALARQSRVTRLYADRGPSADAIEELVAVVDDLHAEFGQQPAVELAGDLEAAHGQDDVGHAVYVDRHWSCLSPSGSQTQSASESETPLRVAAARNVPLPDGMSHR